MATNDYIQIEGKKYATVFGAFQKSTIKPGTHRQAIDGSFDVTYGPQEYDVWQGMIRAPNNPATGYGSKAELITALKLKRGLTFYPHDSTSGPLTAHVIGVINEKSFTPDMHGTSNNWFIDLNLLIEPS